MKRKCFILASSSDRVHLLNECVRCAKKSRYANEDFFLYFQGKGDGIEDVGFFKDIIWDDELRGVFTPRYALMKQFGIDYLYTILIDDDLFMVEDTSYENAMHFLNIEPKAGAVALIHGKAHAHNEMRCVSGTTQYFNVCGGLVFPRRSIEEIIAYFSDGREKDYTEDVVWLLLYIKGYDLYKDFSSYAVHVANRKGADRKLSGYNKMRVEKPHVPMLSEWFYERREFNLTLGCEVWKLKEMSDINERGLEERRRNQQ